MKLPPGVARTRARSPFGCGLHSHLADLYNVFASGDYKCVVTYVVPWRQLLAEPQVIDEIEVIAKG